jgi:hypothetical protein
MGGVGLGARLLTHDNRTIDATSAMVPPIPRQDTTHTIPTTPVPVTPYPCHCGYDVTVSGMGGINSNYCHHAQPITVLLV